MKTFLRLGLIAAILMFATSGYADVTVCVEDPVAGCSGLLFNGLTPDAVVASDGEAPFHPFGITFDVSDAIDLSQFAGYGLVDNNNGNGWMQITGTMIWALPADLSGFGCGVENETTCEPVGSWYFANNFWVDQVINHYNLLEADGSIGDTIVIANNGPNGFAQILFYSDPSAVPEPGSLVLLGTGLIGAAGAIRRRLNG